MILRGSDCRRGRLALRGSVLAAFLLLGCTGNGSAGWALPTPASPLPTILREGAPAWDGGANCAGQLTEGARRLGAALQARFPQVQRVYGYECRPNTAATNELSVHGTGRAIDLVIATIDGAADNASGDPVANWLVEHSSEIGVQLIIWDRTVWIGDQPTTVRSYGGPDPHVDHLHVELTTAASRLQTPFFSTP